MSDNKKPIGSRHYDLDAMTAQEFLSEITLIMDRNPDAAMFSIRFIDKFGEMRLMQMEILTNGELKAYH